MSTAREQILSSVRSALAPLPERTPRPVFSKEAAEPQWLAAETDSIALFQKRAEATGTKCFADMESCAAWLRSQGVRVVYIPAPLTRMASLCSEFCEVTSEYTRTRVNEIDAAFTPSAGAIAESGTIILSDESTPDRLAALAPWHHIALVSRAEIHRTIADALAVMPDDPNLIWVTGPSKTADVEGILIQGVHGPGAQACLIL
jgi:L-lactate dehydrogenase complex protein LldG